ncbi:mitochondrial glycoprotein [Blakeslea trispora]|nr:mitochondrial glycoprotein [Blakeslea trispora]
MISCRILRQSLATVSRAHPVIHRAVITRSTLPFTKPVSRVFSLQTFRSFSGAIPRLSSGTVDPDLAHLLEEELQFEKPEEDEVPAFIKEFLEHNSFHIDDRLGHDKVTLTRLYGNEKIHVVFSISDINNIVEETQQDDTPSEEAKIEEGEFVEKSEKKDEQEDEATSFPVRATVAIEKKDKGCLVFNTVAHDGYLEINAVRHFKEGQAKLEDMSADSIGEQRQDLYMGPVYEELEEELQTTFSRYLEERGIDTALATFLPDYIDYKEQQEYVHWLRNVNDFVSA